MTTDKLIEICFLMLLVSQICTVIFMIIEFNDIKFELSSIKRNVTKTKWFVDALLESWKKRGRE